LNTPIETLRQYSTGNDEATLFDVISFLVKQTCSEIVGLTVRELLQTNSFVMICLQDAVDTPDDDEIPVNSNTSDDDEILVNATVSVTTSVTTLKDQVTTAAKIIDEALVDVKAMPAWSALSTCPGSDEPPVKLVDDNEFGVSGEYFGQIHDTSGQNNIASDITTVLPETFLPATNTVKHHFVPPTNVVPTSNSYSKLSDNDDEDTKDEDSAYAHANMAQSFLSQPSATKATVAPTSYRFNPNGYEIIDEIITSLRNDPISSDDLTWWMSQVRKDITKARTDLAQSFKDTARDFAKGFVKKAKQSLTETASDLMMKNMDQMNKTATAECNKLIGKSFDLQDVMLKADTARLSLIDAHRLANDLLTSIDGHVAHIKATSASRSDDMLDDLMELRNRIDSADYIPRAALASAMASTEQNFAPMSQIDAMLLRMEKLENTISDLKATNLREQPSSPKRHEKFANVDATSFISPPPTPEHHFDYDVPTNGPLDDASLDDVIPYMTTVTVRIGSSTHYNCQVLECIKRSSGTFYKVLNNVGSDFVVQMENIVAMDQSTAFPQHPSYINRAHRNSPSRGMPPRPSPTYGGRGIPFGGRGHGPPPRSNQHSYQNHGHQYKYHDEDDDSIDRRPPHAPRMLGRNEFEYPIGTRNIIREDKVESFLKGNFEPLKPDADPREFYNKIRLDASKYGVLLCTYNEATPSASLLSYDSSNSVNFTAAESTTARVLYDIFDQGQDILFHADNYYHRSIIKNYRDSQDGLALFKKFISHHHVNFRSTQKQSNISSQYQLPQLKSQSLITYISALRTWISETNPMMTPLVIFQLVIDQLKQDPRYAKARNDLELHSDRYATANVSGVDAQHTLARLADTILDYYTTSEKNSLLKPTSATFNALVSPPFKMDICSLIKNPYKRDNKPFAPKFQKDNQSSDKPLYCHGCRSYGHVVLNCPRTGASILIAEFLAKLEPDRKSEIRKEYLKDRKLAHEKYLLSHKDRGNLKKQIKSIEMSIFPTDAERLDLSESAVNEYNNLRNTAIANARIHNMNLDFGSLDKVYDDFAEPMLDFDPDTEEFEA